MAEAPFNLIEKKITDLAGLVVTLKKEKAALTASLDQKGAELNDMARRVEELTRERDEIKAKVEAILSRLEGIEF